MGWLADSGRGVRGVGLGEGCAMLHTPTHTCSPKKFFSLFKLYCRTGVEYLLQTTWLHHNIGATLKQASTALWKEIEQATAKKSDKTDNNK